MTVVLDDIVYRLQHSGGISAYWSELTKRIDGRDVYHLDVGNTQSNLFAANPLSSSERLIRQLRVPLSVGRFLPVVTDLRTPHIFHSSYYRHTTNRHAVTVTTVHDFVYEHLRRGLPKLAHHLQKSSAVSHSDGVICISEATAQDFRRLFPRYAGALRVIYHGVSEDYQPLPGLPRARQVLFVGGRTAYKNFGVAVEALAQLPDYSLVFVGGGALTTAERRLLDDLLGRRYTHREGIGSPELNRLYNESHCLLYPSEYEGFGIPIVEAMKAGCPVVAGTAPVFREIAADAATYLQTTEAAEIIRLVRSLENESHRHEQAVKGRTRARRFSWDIMARETQSFYEEILDGHLHRRS